MLPTVDWPFLTPQYCSSYQWNIYFSINLVKIVIIDLFILGHSEPF